VFLGTSTSGILETELAWRRRDGHGALPPDFNYRGAHALSSLAACVRCALDLQGPAWTASTACSSSAKVFASAARLIEAGLIDAAVVGGVDTLCLTTLYGFSSLELTSQQPCRPYDAERHGISIGEAAAFLLLERADAPIAGNAVFLSGYGESSDAWHMSSPHPEGIGARQAMADALRRAGRLPCDIGYLNLHGTGTLANDLSEGRAVKALFGAATPPCSSTKGATGHTLGAAGALEAVFSILALQDGKVWGSPGTRQVDAAIGLASYALTPRDAPVAHVLSNSLGFGGTNCALVFSRKEALCA
jgi:3-oxoacyl-[acyl-carrier-protein] synthase-1